ncbi:uncharacterized protein LOC116291733 [Actinia tenebrosa]|uniref:Uncharacterized protein LOC116291733 n=1 Tax=Actinia tenebrosa TaxID=6105 RepID=A0A6P8HG45_ACTTE|nr:uncharacterized protein LOC116291733 [Actinia tenebrosa]
MNPATSSSSSSSGSSSESEREPSPLRTRTVKREFWLLKHRVKCIPRGVLEKEMKNSGRTRWISFSPKLSKDQLGDLLKSSMPRLANVSLDRLQVLDPLQEGRKWKG